MAQDIRNGIIDTAKALGINPIDLATAISYETAGTFDPTKKGPRTQWGRHQGLIQFGEPQAKKYGVNWDDPVGSQLGPQGAVANYLRDTGVKPGLGMMDIYSAINAGGVGRYGASDANNGGAPGNVADKVNNQMGPHRDKATAFLGMGSMAVPDGVKGQEAYPQPVMLAESKPAAERPIVNVGGDNYKTPIVPGAVKNMAGMEPRKNGIADIFSLMALQGAQPQQQVQAAPIQGPTPEQANALNQALMALRKRMV